MVRGGHITKVQRRAHLLTDRNSSGSALYLLVLTMVLDKSFVLTALPCAKHDGNLPSLLLHKGRGTEGKFDRTKEKMMDVKLCVEEDVSRSVRAIAPVRNSKLTVWPRVLCR